MKRSFILISFAASSASPPWPILRSVDGYGNTGDGVMTKSLFTDATVRRIFVNPNATKVTLNIACAPSQRLYVDGSEVSSGEVTLKRDREVHNQMVEAVCYDSKIKNGLANKQRYVFMINSDYEKKEITIPHLFMNQVGIDCETTLSTMSSAQLIKCADPKFQDHHVSLTPSGLLSDVEYTLTSSDGEVELRLLNNIPTPAFPYNKSSYTIRASAGTHSQSWELSFGGNLLSNLLYGLGCFLGATLFGLCCSLLLVIGCSSLIGPGVPFGATEVASAFALVMQYFAVSNKLRGSSSMESLGTPLKWVSLFWPSPLGDGVTTMTDTTTGGSGGTGLLDSAAEYLNVNNLLAAAGRAGDGGSHYSSGPSFARAYGISWNEEMLGDISSVENCIGCIFWSFVLLSGLVFIHLCCLGYMRGGGEFTIPHRFALGNWESRAINLITFPVAAASVLAILHPEASTVSVSMGVSALSFIILWLVYSFFQVAQAVNTGDVSWVWETSVRESGPNRKHQDDGYWADTHCDQLLSIPVNRSICGNLFEYKWINTVGDIRPVHIGGTSGGGGGGSSSSSSNGGSLFSSVLRPIGKMNKSPHATAGYLLGKNPQVVHVDQARKPTQPLVNNGSRLMAGVLRTKWLDIMFTMEGLMKFLSYEQVDGGSTPPLPLLVKTSQLSGPITQGSLAFFFDGIRVPFARIAESLWKISIGIALGLAAAISLQEKDSTIPGSCYALVALLSTCQFAYVIHSMPYTRKLDNFVIISVAAIVAASAGAMTRYAYNHRTKLADSFLATTILCATALSFYAIFLIISIFTAICCPPLDESIFLEKLANCSVFVATPDSEFERPNNGGGSTNRGHRGTLIPADEYELPGWTKYAAKDIVAKSTTGRAKLHKFGTFEDLDLHFDHLEIAQACTTGVLPIP